MKRREWGEGRGERYSNGREWWEEKGKGMKEKYVGDGREGKEKGREVAPQ